jgi:hypothetical protein
MYVIYIMKKLKPFNGLTVYKNDYNNNLEIFAAIYKWEVLKLNNKNIGFVFVSLGLVFLMLSLTLALPAPIWSVLLGISIISNITGTAILMRFIKTSQKSIR